MQNNIKTKVNNSNNELALYKVIQTVPYSLIKSTSTKAQRFLNKPLLKKADKMTYT